MATVIGVNTKEYISSLNFMDKRDYLNQVLDITNESNTLVDVLELTGRVKTTDVPEYTHLENSYLFKAGVIATAGVSGGATAGADITITMTTATDNAAPVVGEIVMFQNKRVAVVTASTPATPVFTAKPLDSTTALTDGSNPIAAGQSVIFFSAAAAEGSDDPSTRQSQWAQSKNNVQIFKEAGEITDLQKVSAVEVVYNGKPYIMYKVQHDAFLRHKMKISNAMLFGRRATSTNGTVAGVTVGSDKIYTTQGLRSYILNGDGITKTTGGIEEQYTKSSALTAADIKSLNRNLDKNQAPDEYMGWIGGDLYAALDEYFLALDNVKYGVDFSAFGQGDAKKRAIDLGFDSFRIYGRTFHLNKLKLADHKGLFGAANFDVSFEGYFAPTDKIKIDHQGGTSDRMLLRVMAGDGTNFYPHMETVTGKLAPTPTNTKSVLHVSYQTIAGLQVCGTDHFAMLRGVA